MNSESNNFSIKVGKKLREERERTGLTQTEVAEKAGINANYYSMVERGEKSITYERLQRILKVLNIKSLDID